MLKGHEQSCCYCEAVELSVTLSATTWNAAEQLHQKQEKEKYVKRSMLLNVIFIIWDLTRQGLFLHGNG